MATCQKFIAGRLSRGGEKPKPGSEGTMTATCRCRIATECVGVGEWIKDFRAGPGPSLCQNKRDWGGADPRFAHEMHGKPIDVDLIQFIAVERGLCFAPVVDMEPVSNEFLKIGAIHTVKPVIISSARRPSGAFEGGAKV